MQPEATLEVMHQTSPEQAGDTIAPILHTVLARAYQSLVLVARCFMTTISQVYVRRYRRSAAPEQRHLGPSPQETASSSFFSCFRVLRLFGEPGLSPAIRLPPS